MPHYKKNTFHNKHCASWKNSKLRRSWSDPCGAPCKGSQSRKFQFRRGHISAFLPKWGLCASWHPNQGSFFFVCVCVWRGDVELSCFHDWWPKQPWKKKRSQSRQVVSLLIYPEILPFPWRRRSKPFRGFLAKQLFSDSMYSFFPHRHKALRLCFVENDCKNTPCSSPKSTLTIFYALRVFPLFLGIVQEPSSGVTKFNFILEAC